MKGGDCALRRRTKDSREVDYETVFIGPIWIAIIAIIVIALLAFITGPYAAVEDDVGAIQERNHRAEVFNALPDETRELLDPIISQTLNSDNKLSLEKLPKEDTTDYKSMSLFVLWLILGAAYSISAIWAMFIYACEKDPRYFYVDLPRGWLGFGIAMLTLPFIPVYVLSALHMLIWRLGRNYNEKLAVEEAARGEIEFERFRKPLFDPRAHRIYVRYVTRGRGASNEWAKRQAEEKVAKLEKALQDDSERIRQNQRDLATARQTLKDFSFETEVENRERAEREWEQIREMRGVSSIRVHNQKGQKPDTLIIRVKVRVPYDGDLYDFGDYDVKINGYDYVAKRTRSGVRANASSTKPDYNESNGFCFGSRKGDIATYLKNGRLLEGITLIIDSLHSVNSEEAERMIPHCFRRVSTISRAKRKLLKGGVIYYEITNTTRNLATNVLLRRASVAQRNYRCWSY